MDISKTNFIWHIGLHKTATSWLQGNCLPYFGNTHLVRGWYQIRNLVNDNINNETIIISDEAICGHPYQGYYFKQFQKRLRRIHTISPQAKIIMGVRKHADWIRSLYRHFILHYGGTHSLKEFYHPNGHSLLSDDDIALTPRIKYIQERFDEVYLYKFQELRDEPIKFVHSLEDFIGEEVALEDVDFNARMVGLTAKPTKFLRQVNKVDHWLNTWHLPGWRNRVTRKLGISPEVFFKMLSRYMNKRYQLPNKYREVINEKWNDDWKSIIKFCNTN